MQLSYNEPFFVFFESKVKGWTDSSRKNLPHRYNFWNFEVSRLGVWAKFFKTHFHGETVHSKSYFPTHSGKMDRRQSITNERDSHIIVWKRVGSWIPYDPFNEFILRGKVFRLLKRWKGTLFIVLAP